MEKRRELGISEKYRKKLLSNDIDSKAPSAKNSARDGLERRENWILGGCKGKAGDGFRPPEKKWVSRLEQMTNQEGK